MTEAQADLNKQIKLTYSHSYSKSSAFYNFAKLTCYSYGKLDKALLVQVGVIIGAEFLDSYLLNGLAQSTGLKDFGARFIRVQAVSFGLNLAKEFLYSNIVTQHATPNANRNFIELWQGSNSSSKVKPKLNEKYGKILSNFYSESSVGAYQVGNVGRGILSSASKLFISLWSLFRGSIYEFLAIGAYIVTTALASFFLNKKLFSLFKEVKTLDSEIKLLPLTSKNIKEVVNQFDKTLTKQQASENKMQKLKVVIFIITIIQDILSAKRGVQHLEKIFNTDKSSNAGEAANLKFNEGTTFISWVNTNAFRIVDGLHRVTATNKVLQEFFNYSPNEQGKAKNTNTSQHAEALSAKPRSSTDFAKTITKNRKISNQSLGFAQSVSLERNSNASSNESLVKRSA